MKIGKIPPGVLQGVVFRRTGAQRKEVVVGPAVGEDAAIIDIGGRYVAVHTDPITGSVKLLGYLAVYIPTNDIAVRGIPPMWLSVALLLPPEVEEGDLDVLTAQIDAAARELGAAVVGGHTEVTTAVTRPVAVVTAAGVGERYVTTSGARPGDVVLMTKSAGQEAASILATDFREEALRRGVSPASVERAGELARAVSVAREALAVADLATSMHDPTEGGVANGLAEVAYASGVSIEVDPGSVVVYREVEELCSAFGVDPLETLSSGVLLATVPPDRLGEAEERLRKLGVSFSQIGRVTERRGYLVKIGDRLYREPHVEDKLFTLFS
ncbi:AIR synthase family protein [Pyrobaculum neutrophilum]|uniref:AIR synthase related protein domain protein n=1 Tax=Pyrobaculum neutrophilum (strain DSM 2338 / JCM 9278 / NBRC 100436 / V24Sta) TaxID=444157 RepID=B1YAL5_PYRNV|nr:AIR synthase family protein [Pyrobaculum neutrophilum]ACB39094.1 AIR synthase related protein domain protein [Pyrobaculum neutrophilum V24Sta]